MRVALQVPCLVDAMFPQVAQATVRLLERLGHQVEFPRSQTCCGQMHINNGFSADAIPLVRHHVEVFERALDRCEAIVAPSGSCVATVRHQHHKVLEQLDGPMAQRASVVAGHTYELSELLVDRLGVTDVGASYHHRVTYHPTCHSLRALDVGNKPLSLLGQVRGIDLVELGAADVCCGFGGTFALKNAGVSTAMLADKVGRVLASRAEVCTAGDVSCLMQIGGGLSRMKTGVRTVHLAEILASTEEP